MKVLALYSIKGGVGKTAAAVNLSRESARCGYRTLIWDLDPQGAASYYFRIRARLDGGARAVFSKTLGDGIKATDYTGLDLLPADFTYRNLDLLLDQRRRRKKSLARVTDRFVDDYDRLILDCAPGISLVSENVFRSADLLLNPLIPSTLSVRTLEQLDRFLARSELPELRFNSFFSMVDRRRKLHRDLMTDLAASRSDVLAASVPDSSVVERMGVTRQPVAEYAARSSAATAYRQLWQEVDALLRQRKAGAG